VGAPKILNLRCVASCRFCSDSAMPTISSFLFVRHIGLSRLSGQGVVAMLGGSRPNPFCECAIVVDHQKLHTACVIALGTPSLRRELGGGLLGGVEFFKADYSSYGVAR